MKVTYYLPSRPLTSDCTWCIVAPHHHTFRALMLMCHWYGLVAAAAPHGCFDHCKITIYRHSADVVNNIVDRECSFRTSFSLHMQYWGWATPHPLCIRSPPSNNSPKTTTYLSEIACKTKTIKYSQQKIMYNYSHIQYLAFFWFVFKWSIPTMQCPRQLEWF